MDGKISSCLFLKVIQTLKMPSYVFILFVHTMAGYSIIFGYPPGVYL